MHDSKPGSYLTLCSRYHLYDFDVINMSPHVGHDIHKRTNQLAKSLHNFIFSTEQPRGLVVRASGYKSRGPGFDSRLYHEDSPCGGGSPW